MSAIEMGGIREMVHALGLTSLAVCINNCCGLQSDIVNRHGINTDSEEPTNWGHTMLLVMDNKSFIINARQSTRHITGADKRNDMCNAENKESSTLAYGKGMTKGISRNQIHDE